jgi:hypothetical protein
MNQQLLPPDCGLRSLFFMAGPARDDKAFAGQTSLHHVCKSAEISKLMKLLRALKAVGSDLRAMDTVDGRGFTPFHVACAGGHAQVRRSHSGVPVRAICLGQGMLTAAVLAAHRWWKRCATRAVTLPYATQTAALDGNSQNHSREQRCSR